MRLALSSPARKALFVAGVVLLLGSFATLATRRAVAARAANRLDRESLQRAIHLDPMNAEYYDTLGQICNNNLDTDCAERGFLDATSRNPHVAAYWLNLASVYGIQGQLDKQGRALAAATYAEPTSPRIAWAAAIYYLVRGDTLAALHQLRVVLTSDPTLAEEALSLSWRATHDVNQILISGMPAIPAVHAQLVNLLVEQHELDAAGRAWERMLALPGAIPPRLGFPYIDALLAAHRIAAAQKAWDELRADSELRLPPPQPPNLLLNPSFEEDIENGGFDWRYDVHAHVAVNLTSEAEDGNRALQFTLDGEDPTPPTLGVRQYAVVRPASRYRLSGYMKTSELVGAGRPRFVVRDFYNSRVLAVTEVPSAPMSWTRFETQFETDSQAELVVVAIDEVPMRNVKGTVWVDNISLVKLP